MAWFLETQHWDWIWGNCLMAPPACRFAGELAGQILATFYSKYMPPEYAGDLRFLTPDLVPPEPTLARPADWVSWLTVFERAGCGLVLCWEETRGALGSEEVGTVPPGATRPRYCGR
jgi:hypothetical protein